MPDLGYYTLPVLPTFKGNEARIGADLDRVFGRAGTSAGKALTSAASRQIAADKSIERATAAKAKAADKLADAVGKVRTAEASLTASRSSGNTARVVAAEERLASARRKTAAETRGLTTASRDLESAIKSGASSAKTVATSSGGSGSGGMMGLLLYGTMGTRGLTQMGGTAGQAAGLALKAGLAGVLTAAAGAAIAAPFFAAFKLFDWGASVGLPLERTMNTLQGVTAASKSEMVAAGIVARSLGADIHLAGVTASDAAAAMTELAKGGFTVQQAMEAARGTVQLATAGQIDAAEAAKYVTAAINMFQLQASDATRVADLLAAAAAASSANVSDLGMALQQGGSVAAGFGNSIEDTITALTVFSKWGINSSDAGTMLKTALIAITDKGKPAQAAIDELGLSLYDAQGNFVGIESLMKQVADASTRMTQEQFQAATAVLFGSDAMRTSMVAANGGAKAWDDTAKQVRRAGAAADMAGAQMQGLPGVVEGLSNTMDSLKLSVYDAGNAIVTALGQQALGSLSDFASWIQDHQPEIIGFFTAIGTQAVAGIDALRSGAEQAIDVVADLVNIVGDAAGGIMRFYSWSQRILGRTDAADEADRQAEAMFGWSDGLEAVVRKLHDAHDPLVAFGDKLQRAGDQANTSARFMRDIGQAAAEIHGPDIVIKENTPEVLAAIDKTKFAVETMPDGKIKIVPLTQEALDEMNAWRKQQGDQPVNIEVKPTIDPSAQARFDDWFKQWTTVLYTPQTPDTAPPGIGNFGPDIGNFRPAAPTAPRAAGGLFSAAFGRMPRDAIIQPARPGLVQWAEPSTGGEAYIPLNGGDRSRRIWAETGARLGMFRSHEAGAVVTPQLTRDDVEYIGRVMFGLDTMSAFRNEKGSYHSTGQGIDIAEPGKRDSPRMLAFAQYMHDNFGPQLLELIHFNPAFSGHEIKDGHEVPDSVYAGAGDHHDHVHVAARGKAGTPGLIVNRTPGAAGPTTTGAVVPDWAAIAQKESGGNWAANTGNGFFGGLQFTQSTWDAYKPAGAPGRADLATRDQQIAAAQATLAAQGPGAWPNTFTTTTSPTSSSTPYGQNSTGAGSYEVDADKVREANERVADANQRIAEADAKVREEEAALRELKPDAKESERIRAQNQLDAAKADAAKARREADDAKAGLDEAKRGTFKAADTTTPGGTDTAGGPQLSEIGSIMSQFLKDTFGFGDLLPDPSQMGIFKLLGAIMGIKLVPRSGSPSTPGGISPFGGSITDPLDVATSLLPFGMIPNAVGGITNPTQPGTIIAPPMPEGAAHLPAAGPNPPGPVDNSVNVTVNGYSQAEVVNGVRRELQWAPRVNTYTQV